MSKGNKRKVWSVCLFATGFKKAKTEGKKCHPKTMKSKKKAGKTLK